MTAFLRHDVLLNCWHKLLQVAQSLRQTQTLLV